MPRAQLDVLSSHGAHQGIALEVGNFPYADVADILDRAGEGPALVVVLDHVTDDGNFGAIVRSAEVALVSGSVETQVESLTSDSRKVRENTAFVCIVGAVSDGHTYIQAAVEQKASVIVVQQGCKEEYLAQIPDTVTVVSVENTRYALAFMSAAYFDDPAEKLFTIGITGTKGKTTTTYMIRNVLEACGIKTGLIGTIETIIGDESWASCNTTPESYQIHESFAKMVKAGCKAVVMEVSSQGLKLDRTAGILFDIGVFTNLEPDHIGPNEHASFEEYLACKAKLFSQCKTGIVNADDKHTAEVIKNATCENRNLRFIGKSHSLEPATSA